MEAKTKENEIEVHLANGFFLMADDYLAQILTHDIVGNRIQVTVNTKGQVHVYRDRHEMFEYAGLVADEEGGNDE